MRRQNLIKILAMAMILMAGVQSVRPDSPSVTHVAYAKSARHERRIRKRIRHGKRTRHEELARRRHRRHRLIRRYRRLRACKLRRLRKDLRRHQDAYAHLYQRIYLLRHANPKTRHGRKRIRRIVVRV